MAQIFCFYALLASMLCSLQGSDTWLLCVLPQGRDRMTHEGPAGTLVLRRLSSIRRPFLGQPAPLSSDASVPSGLSWASRHPSRDPSWQHPSPPFLGTLSGTHPMQGRSGPGPAVVRRAWRAPSKKEGEWPGGHGGLFRGRREYLAATLTMPHAAGQARRLCVAKFGLSRAYGLWPMACGPCSMVWYRSTLSEARPVQHGLGEEAWRAHAATPWAINHRLIYSLWFMAYGLCYMKGLGYDDQWFTVYGLWSMVLWFMVYDLWYTPYGNLSLWRMPYGQ